MFEYDWRQYGQLGEWHCPNCGFARPALDFAAENVQLGAEELEMLHADVVFVTPQYFEHDNSKFTQQLRRDYKELKI